MTVEAKVACFNLMSCSFKYSNLKILDLTSVFFLFFFFK